jgi:hypothetical protein
MAHLRLIVDNVNPSNPKLQSLTPTKSQQTAVNEMSHFINCLKKHVPGLGKNPKTVIKKYFKKPSELQTLSDYTDIAEKLYNNYSWNFETDNVNIMGVTLAKAHIEYLNLSRDELTKMVLEEMHSFLEFVSEWNNQNDVVTAYISLTQGFRGEDDEDSSIA